MAPANVNLLPEIRLAQAVFTLLDTLKQWMEEARPAITASTSSAALQSPTVPPGPVQRNLPVFSTIAPRPSQSNCIDAYGSKWR